MPKKTYVNVIYKKLEDSQTNILKLFTNDLLHLMHNNDEVKFGLTMND